MKHLRADGGLCNRLRAIASGIEWAKRAGDRLEVLWRINGEMEFLYTDVFERPQRFKLVERRNETLMCRFLYSRFNPFKEQYAARYSNFLNSTDFSWLEPRENIRKAIDEYVKDFSTNVIGVHIRRTDNKESIEKSPLSAFVSAMDAELAKNANVLFYVASDDPDVKRKLLIRYGGNRVVVRQNTCGRFTAGGAYDAVLDLFLLSRTSAIFGSYWSSFSEVASMIGNIPLRIILSEND